MKLSFIDEGNRSDTPHRLHTWLQATALLATEFLPERDGAAGVHLTLLPEGIPPGPGQVVHAGAKATAGGDLMECIQR